MIKAVHIEEKINELKGKSWQPIEVVKLNDQVIRLAYFIGEYHWHKHNNADEMFFVYEGSISIDIKDQETAQLKAGEMIVVPKGLEHRPCSEKGAFVLLFEPKDLQSKGD